MITPPSAGETTRSAPSGRQSAARARPTRAAGAAVIAATAIINRSGGRAALDVPLHALVDLSLPTYAPDACPLCSQGLPLTKPGSRPTAGAS
jgi:orotate phosphoribosyltransferase